MNTYQKMSNSYEMNILWNDLAGKNKNSFTETDLKNQWERIVEEVDEFYGNAEKHTPTRDSYIRIIDDISDIFVTASLYNHVIGEKFPTYDDVVGTGINTEQDFLGMVSNVLDLPNLNTSSVFNVLKGVVALSVYFDLKNKNQKNISENLKLFDISGALDAVILNNFSKYVSKEMTNHDYIVSQTFKRYEDVGVYTVETDDYTIFKRNGDDKIMKPYGFEPVDLTPFVW